MRTKDKQSAFAAYHPLINFIYYIFVIAATIIALNPLYLVVAFICAFAYFALLEPKSAFKFLFLLGIPMIALMTIINPLINHHGTVIENFYIGNNPVTIEALIFGLVSGVMIVTVLLWFSSYNKIISSDKFIYLFGRVIPKIALILSMALRLIPKMTAQLKIISNAQNMIGKGMRGGGPIKKIKHGLRILSILITWSLENAIETADSMKARGYGLKGRTSYTLYKFYKRDKILLPILCTAIVFCIVGLSLGAAFFNYRVFIGFPKFGLFEILVFVSYAIICFVPIIIEIKERAKWHYLISKI